MGRLSELWARLAFIEGGVKKRGLPMGWQATGARRGWAAATAGWSRYGPLDFGAGEVRRFWRCAFAGGDVAYVCSLGLI